MPYIADGEKSRNVRLKQKWIAVERPAFGALALSYQVGARENESALVSLDDSCKPVRLRQRSYENEHRTCGHAINLVGIRTEKRDFLEVGFAVGFGDAGIRPKLNIRPFFDLVDQILRHGARYRTASHDDDDSVSVLCEIHRRLSGRIRAADHVDDFPFA